MSRQFPNARPRLEYSAELANAEPEEKFAPVGPAIADLMAEHGVAGYPIGVYTWEVGAILSLQEAGLRVLDATPLVEAAGTVKTEDEVAIYRTIGRQYEHTVKAFRGAIRPGVSEKELARVVVAAWSDADGEDISQLNVCSGENMNPWRRWPTDRPLQAGDLVGIDLHARGVDGLRGDVSRTFLVGEQFTSEQRDLYRRAYDYMHETAACIRAGRTFGEVMDTMPRVPARYQTLLDNYQIFHGVGMWAAESPKLIRKAPKRDEVLKPNQVLAVESYFGEEGGALAVKLELPVLVREDGLELIGGGMPFDERLLA
ncbi:MAG: peptidase [Chloroflexi bacterium]|nr:peptidase [Chloroflexota bacterium]